MNDEQRANFFAMRRRFYYRSYLTRAGSYARHLQTWQFYRNFNKKFDDYKVVRDALTNAN